MKVSTMARGKKRRLAWHTHSVEGRVGLTGAGPAQRAAARCPLESRLLPPHRLDPEDASFARKRQNIKETPVAELCPLHRSTAVGRPMRRTCQGAPRCAACRAPPPPPPPRQLLPLQQLPSGSTPSHAKPLPTGLPLHSSRSMPFLDASSSDSEPLLLVAGGANRPRAVVLRPPPAAAASDSDSDGSSTDLEDGSRFSSIPETVQSRIAAQPSAEPSNSGTSAASSSRSARPLSPAAARPTGSSRRRPDVARPSPRHRRSSSGSVVWLADDEQPVAGPSRAWATSPRAPRPPPAASSDDDDEIQIEGETGPRHRRRGLALSNYVAGE
jgi:hypothetical protein